MCKEDGTVLRAIVLDECEGAPHEFRGVYRGGLLRALQSGVPPDCIQYNSAVQSIVQDDDGESLTLTLSQSRHSMEVMNAHKLQASRESRVSDEQVRQSAGLSSKQNAYLPPTCRSVIAGVSVSLESGELLRGPVLVGADGVRSRVAAALGLREPNYAGYIAYRSANLQNPCCGGPIGAQCFMMRRRGRCGQPSELQH